MPTSLIRFYALEGKKKQLSFMFRAPVSLAKVVVAAVKRQQLLSLEAMETGLLFLSV